LNESPSGGKSKAKTSDGDVNFLKVGKKFSGLFDRFPPGRAWYHNTHI